ncbi:MAG: OstA-like protein [Acidaminococcaceae bacterium]
MKKQAMILLTLLSMSVVTTAWAAPAYEGGKLSNRQGPSFADKEATKDTQVLAAEADTKNKQAVKAVLPITLYGDEVNYHKADGSFSATGNVRMMQGGQVLLTSKVEGNMQTGDVYLNEGGQLLENFSDMHGEWVHYNFNTKNGELKKINGKSEEDFFKAPHGTIAAGVITLDEGASSTRCPAVVHDPCILFTADKIEIYPQDKMIAYDVKVYLKGKHIYSRDRIINKLDGSEDQSAIPRIGFESENGMRLTYQDNRMLSKKDVITSDLAYYSKAGWKPMFSYKHDERNFYFKLQTGNEEDSDNNWIKKSKNVILAYKPHHIGKLPVAYSLYFNRGLWEDDNQTSWHTEYGVYLNHDRINLDQKHSLFLDLGVGYKRVHEEVGDTTESTMLYNASLGKQFDAKWSSWLSYYRQNITNNIFNYDQPDMGREVQVGVGYEFDKKNKVIFLTRYDEGERSLYEYNLRYIHKFCCFNFELEYRDIKFNGNKEWNIKYEIMNW